MSDAEEFTLSYWIKEAYAQAVRDEALETAAKIAEKASRIGVIRSLEATHKAQAAIEIAAAIRALKEQS